MDYLGNHMSDDFFVYHHNSHMSAHVFGDFNKEKKIFFNLTEKCACDNFRKVANVYLLHKPILNYSLIMIGCDHYEQTET